jgi:hypothetical protein
MPVNSRALRVRLSGMAGGAETDLSGSDGFIVHAAAWCEVRGFRWRVKASLVTRPHEVFFRTNWPNPLPLRKDTAPGGET